MESFEKRTKPLARPSLSVGLCVSPVAWWRTDTPRTTITESEDIAFAWELDGLFYEPLYAGQQVADMQAEIDKLRAELLREYKKGDKL
mgnify:CR=1 FL=1